MSLQKRYRALAFATACAAFRAFADDGMMSAAGDAFPPSPFPAPAPVVATPPTPASEPAPGGNGPVLESPFAGATLPANYGDKPEMPEKNPKPSERTELR